MPNDAKLGLVLGTGLVIIIAVVFFRKDSASAQQPDRPAAAVNPASTLPTISPGTRPVSARGLKHTVKEGETLFSLAHNYYKDSGRFVDIYRTNREALASPDHLEPGTVLVIPDAPE